MEKDKKITIKLAYEAMIKMLYEYWKLTGSKDLTDVLSGGEYWHGDEPADSAFWDYWIEAIESLEKGDEPLRKNLKK